MGSAASPTFVPFHHPPTPLPQKTPQPPLIFFLVSASLLSSSTRRTRSEGDKSSKRSRAPPSLPCPRSTPIGADCSRGTPIEARRAALLPIEYTEAVSSFLQLAVTVSSGFHQLSNNVLLLYLRLLLSYLPSLLGVVKHCHFLGHDLFLLKSNHCQGIH